MNPPPSSPNSAPAPLNASASRAKTWSAGSLTYTIAGLVPLFGWLLLGDFAYWMRERSAAPVTQLLLKKNQASDLVVGLFLLTIPWAAVLIVGPVVSYWSDHHRGRWGRRIPFLFVPVPFITLSMIGLAFSPRLGVALNQAWGGDPESAQRMVLLVMGACWTIFEIGVVVSNSVFNGLVNDVVPRELLGRFYGMFRAVGLGAGVLFNYKIIGHAEDSYAAILIGVGLIYGVGFTVMCLRVKEGEYPPPPPVPAGPRHPVVGAMGAYFRDCFARPYYLWVFLFLGLASLAFVPVNTFSLFAAKRYSLSLETYGRYLVVTYACSFALAFPLGWLADRFHPLKVGLAAIFLYGTTMLAGFAWVHDARSFGVVFLAHGVLAGSFMTGSAAVAQMLFPKLKFAQFAAAAGLVAGVFNMTLGPLLGGVLDRLGGDYRYTFLFGGLIGLLALGAGVLVYHRWAALGGAKGYVAPE